MPLVEALQRGLNRSPFALSSWERILLEVCKMAIFNRRDLRVYCEGDGGACVSDRFLAEWSVPRRLVQSGGCPPTTPQTHIGLYSALVVGSNATSLIRTIRGFKVKAVVRMVFTWMSAGSPCDDEQDMTDVFRASFWSNIQHALAVVRRVGSRELAVHTYQPFRAGPGPGRCFNFSPVLLDEWRSHDGDLPNLLDGVWEFRNRSKRLAGFGRPLVSLHACPLRVTSFYMPPFTKPQQVPGYKKGWRLAGNMAPMLRTLSRYMNFTPVLMQTSDNEFWGVRNASRVPVSGMIADIFHNRTDLGFARMDVMRELVVTANEDSASCVTWCIPATHESVRAWEGITRQLGAEVWLGLALCAVLALCALRVLTRGRVPVVRLVGTLVLPLVQQSLPMTPVDRAVDDLGPGRSSAARCVLAHWLLLALVMSSGYLSALSKFNAEPFSRAHVTNLEELVASNVSFAISRSLAELIEAWGDKSPLYRAIASRIKYRTGDYERVADLISTGRFASFMTWDYCKYYKKKLKSRKRKSVGGRVVFALHAMLESSGKPTDCPLILPVGYVSMAAGSPYKWRLGKGSTRLMESGLITRWERHVFPRQNDALRRPLNMEVVRPALELHVLGMAVGTLAFLLEGVVHRVRVVIRDRNSF